MAGSVRVQGYVLKEMLLHARREPELECCGLLAGRDGVITEIFPARNALASATAYEIAPQELFRIFREMHARDLTHLGIYHSHPATENKPSPTDIEKAYYPDIAYFIISPLEHAPNPIRAFSICEGAVREIQIERANAGD